MIQADTWQWSPGSVREWIGGEPRQQTAQKFVPASHPDQASHHDFHASSQEQATASQDHDLDMVADPSFGAWGALR